MPGRSSRCLLPNTRCLFANYETKDNGQRTTVSSFSRRSKCCRSGMEMIAELANWLRRSLTSRRSLRRTVFQQNLGIWKNQIRRCLSVPKSDKTGIAEGQLSLDIGDLVSACTTEADLSQKIQALSKSDKFAYLRQHSTVQIPESIHWRMQS
eukprot:Em0011g563a